MKKYISYDNEMPIFQKLVMDGYFLMKRLSLTEEKAFGLDTSNVKIEKVPLLIVPPKDFNLKRIE